jgi:conjugal transfer pilus assembly protein TraF
MKIRFITALLTAVGTLVLPCIAAQADAAYFSERERGWFWYEEPPPEAIPPAPLTVPPIAELQPEPPPEQESTDPGPPPLSAAWYRENLEHYRDAAIDNPTPENVRAFYYLQKVMMDKASAFTAMAGQVVEGDPLLDATAERPLASYAVYDIDRAAFLARQEVLRDIARSAGLMFFIGKDCPQCESLAPIIRALAARLGFTIVVVSVDGVQPPPGMFATVRQDEGQAQQLGVTVLPSLYLARPPDQIMAIVQGPIAAEALEKRLVLLAKQANWITQAAFDRTLPVRRTTRVPAAGEIDPAILSDPTRLVEYLRAAMPNTGAR